MIDISAFCVKFEAMGRDRLRLVLHVAPRNGSGLAMQLRRFKAKRKNGGAVVCRVPQHVATLARELGVEPRICDLVDRYAATWSGANKGSRVDPNRQAARREAVRTVLMALGGPYPSWARSDSDPIINAPHSPPSPHPSPLQHSPPQPTP